MTENEAIRELHNIRPRGSIIPQKRAEALDVAIQALAEIQQYRAIGTIEECRTAVERMKPKKPTEWANGTKHCPNPDCEFDNTCLWFKVCVNCGQALDRSE